MNHVRFLVASILVALSSLAHAGGNAEAGKAASLVCATCHGQDGATGIDPSYPNLAGQGELYLSRQLEMILSGERPVALMAGQLNGKSPQDLADLAAYYASLPGKPGQAAGDDDSIELAENIFRGGIGGKRVAACGACHGPTGMGNALAGFPGIAGQSDAYTIAQLVAYREGERTTDESFGGMMRDVAHGLTDGEIKALADYLKRMH